jgi:hypothetical protein
LVLAKLGHPFLQPWVDLDRHRFAAALCTNPNGNLHKLQFQRLREDLGEVIRSFSTPPFLAMNLGALMALKVPEQSQLAPSFWYRPAAGKSRGGRIATTAPPLAQI